ncbi:unnamed protein product [Alternaria alternata]
MVRNLRDLSELWSRIKTQTAEVAEYEQAIARLGGTIDDECMSTIKARRRILQTELEDKQERYKTMANWSLPKCLPEDSSLTVISISALSQAISAEVKALEDVTAIHLSLVQLTANRAGLEKELQNIRRAKERTQTEPIDSMDAMEDDNEIKDLESSIEEYADKIQEHESLVISLHQKAWVAMRAANRAAKSDIEVPGFGSWTPISAPTTVTTASDVVTAAPITVSTAQVKVADIPPEVKAAAKDLQASTASDVVATVPRSITATIKVDKTLSSITLCAPQKQYVNVKSVEQTEFAVGDIGWFPVLRPSLSESSSDIHTEFGYICAKSYPLIIVEKLEDCMLGLIISTSNGNGLSLKCASVKRRSTLLIPEYPRNSTVFYWGQELHPKKMLRVKDSSEYSPPVGAYVDMLNLIMIPFDTRFQKKGDLISEDVLDLQQMRLSAVLAQSGAGKLGNLSKFRKWYAEWYGKSTKAARG